MLKPQKRKNQKSIREITGVQSSLFMTCKKPSPKELESNKVTKLNAILNRQPCRNCLSKNLILLNTDINNLTVSCLHGCGALYKLPITLNTLELEVIA